MTLAKHVLLATLLILGAAQFAEAQNWTITTPANNSNYAPTSFVTGQGDASGVGHQAVFKFRQKDGSGGWITRGWANVVGVAKQGGLVGAMWSQTLDPAAEQPATGQWPTSALDSNGNPTRDYKTTMIGFPNSDETVNHKVE